MASALVSKLRMNRPTVKVSSPAGVDPTKKEGSGTTAVDTGTGASKVKDAAARRSEDQMWHSASLPRRRTTIDRNMTPELNAYIKGKALKGEPTSYLELARYLGELRATGEKGHRQLLTTILPRLAQFGVLPASLVPQLLQLMGTGDDRRLARFAYYMLQVLLGAGSAGTPSPTPGPSQSGASDIPAEVAAKAWQTVLEPIADTRTVDLEIRTLAAAARGSDGRHDKELVQAVRTLLDRAASSPSQLSAGKRGARRSSQAETWDVQWSALSSIRTALKGKAQRDAASHGLDGIVSQEPVAARHALALLVGLARHNAIQLLEQHKELASLASGAASSYESSGLVVGSDSKKTSPNKLQALGATINIVDKWARVYLARLCAAMLYADWSSATEFVKGPGAPFWRMLTLLATRDKEGLVVLEAIKAMFGCLPPAAGHLFAASSSAAPSEDPRDAKMRARAWALVSSEAKQPAVHVPGLQSEASATLMGALGTALCNALQSGSAPSVCAACRAAGAMTEARARGVSGTAEAEGICASVTEALSAVLQSDASPVERCAALEALIWAQKPDPLPSSIVRHISASGDEGASASRWSGDLLQSLFHTLQKILRAVPPAAGTLLGSAAALAAAAPSAIKADMLFAMWNTALMQGEGARMAAFSSALQIVSSPQWPASTRPATGADASALRKAAADDAAWTELQRGATWWLGEFANAVAGEVAGQSSREEDDGYLDENDLASISPAEVVALQALRNAPINAAISHLQQATAVQPWPVRMAAVQALAKVAVRSEEPYRLQCYTFLTAVSSSDCHGLASHLQPVLAILDALYSTRAVLEKLAQQHGDLPGKWPPGVVKQLRQRHNQLSARIERHICSLANAEYYPIGPRSRELLTSGVEGLAPGEQLPSDAARVPDGLAALVTERDTPFDDRVPADLDSDEESPRASPGRQESVPMTPILNGSDPLTELTRDLDDRLRADAYRQRGLSPWQTTFDAEPSYGEEDVASARYSYEAEQPAFGFTERDSDLGPGYHSRTSSADKVHYVNGRGVVQHTFDAEVPEELSVYPGEEVEVVAEVDGWLHCVASNGSKGLVPASYISLLGAEQSFRTTSPSPQMEQQPSFDPLAEPDMLAALTQAAPPPLNSWMSFDEPDASPFRQPLDASPAFDRSSRSLDTSQGAEETWSMRFETDFESGPAESAADATMSGPLRESPAVSSPVVPTLSLQEIDAAIDKEMDDLKAMETPKSEVPAEGKPPTQTSAQPAATPGPDISRPSDDASRPAAGDTLRRQSFSTPPLGKTVSARSVASSSGAPVTPGRHSRSSSVVEGAVSPRVTPRHSRTSSIEAIANAASFVQPYKAQIIYGFDAEAEDELSVTAGDEVTVHVEIEGWVQVTRARDGQKGLVPASYVVAA